MDRQDYISVPQSSLSPNSPSFISQTSSRHPLRSPAFLHDEQNVFVRRPWVTYSQLLGFLVAALAIPLLFYLGLSQIMGGVPASQLIADYSMSDPRTTAQIVTIIASFFTASVRWALGGASTVLARKRFGRPRPIVEMEVFSALKNGAVAWTWRRRQEAMFGTWVVVVLTGLLTSGFVGLISPFPIAVTSEIDGGRELDFLSFNGSCFDRYTATWDQLFCINGTCNQCYKALTYGEGGFVYTGCPVQDQFTEVLNAAKSSMISHFASSMPPERRSNLVYSFAQLANTRISGRTAGTVPTGPGGFRYFSPPAFQNVSKSTSSYNYTLNLQGIWAEASCEYIDDSASALLVYQKTDGWYTYKSRCLRGFSPIRGPGKLWSEGAKNGILLAGGCFNEARDEYAFDLRSFSNLGDYEDEALPPSTTTTAKASATARRLRKRQPFARPPKGGQSPPLYRHQAQNNTEWTYAGMNAMHCTLKPQAGLVNATFETELAAFNISHAGLGSSPFRDMANLTKDIAYEAMSEILGVINEGQTEWSANMLGGVIRTVSIAYGNLTGWNMNPLVTQLVADALLGIFEYEVTHLRLVLTASNHTLPDTICTRQVNGTLVERSIGWNSQRSTILGLIPLMLIGGLSIVMVIWAMMATGRLSIFDPTSPVSIIAATSVGDVAFYNNREKDASPLVGDPEDENVRDTRVQYGYHAGVWGLKSLED